MDSAQDSHLRSGPSVPMCLGVGWSLGGPGQGEVDRDHPQDACVMPSPCSPGLQSLPVLTLGQL